MALFQVDSTEVQKHQDAIGKALFALEADPALKGKMAPLHAALLAGETYTVAQSKGSVRPQDGGGNKDGHPPG